MTRNVLRVVAAAGALSVAASAALAQQAPASGSTAAADSGIETLEAIIVTARKRSERLVDVPAPVSAVTQAQIDALRLQDARDLMTIIPTAFLQENNAGTARDISIRGVSTPNLFAESGVATYIDEVYSSGFISYPTQFYDVERIEVLRGPQGTLYGRNAVGGAVNVISRRPTDQYEGSARITYGSFDRLEAEATANLPFSAGFGLRATGWYTDQDHGEYFNPMTGKYLDATNGTGGRLVAEFRPIEGLSVTLIGETTQADTQGTLLFFPTAGETKDTVARDTQPANDYSTSRGALEVDWETGNGKVTLIAGKRKYTLTGIEDTDLTGDNPFNLAYGQLGEQVTDRRNDVDSTYAELRWLSGDLGPWSLLAGMTYLDESADGYILSDLPTVSLIFTGGALPASIAIDNRQSVRSWAGFAEATYAFSDQASLIVGVRYNSDDKSVDFDFAPTPLLQAFVGPPQVADTSRTFTNFSPGATFAWSPSADWHLYGRIQTGFRAGGYNFNVASVANLPYDSEESINFEVGAKRELLDGRGLVAVTVYELKQRDVLVTQYDPTAPGPLAGYLSNVGKSRTHGIELEGSAEVADGLLLSGSIGYLDAEFTEGTSNGASIDGKQVPSSRKLTYALTAGYRHPMSEGLALSLNASYTYRDSGYQDVLNTQTISDAKLLNASAALEFGHFELGAYVKNALDDDYEVAFGGFRPPSSFGVLLAQGISYGGWIRAKF